MLYQGSHRKVRCVVELGQNIAASRANANSRFRRVLCVVLVRLRKGTRKADGPDLCRPRLEPSFTADYHSIQILSQYHSNHTAVLTLYWSSYGMVVSPHALR